MHSRAPSARAAGLVAVALTLALAPCGRRAGGDPDPSARAAGRRAETLPSAPGTLRRLYRPEFRSADSLAEALGRFGVAGATVALVTPWVDELRPGPQSPPPGAALVWPRPTGVWSKPAGDWDPRDSLEKWQDTARRQLVPVRVPTRLLLQGPTSDVERLEQALARFDRPLPSVTVGLTIAEVRCESRRERGGHALFSRDAAPDSPDTIFRGTSAEFEPEAWMRARLTGLVPFPGTSVVFERFRSDDGLFEHVLRGLALRQEAEMLAQPCLVCTEESACGLESVVQVPALTLTAGVPVPRVDLRPVDAGLRLGLRAVRIGVDTAVLDLRVQLRTAEPDPAPDAIPGAVVLRTRELATRVTVRDGESLVLGGLFLTRRLGDRRNSPFVSAVPGLEVLATRRGAGVRHSELLFVLAPRGLAVGGAAPREAAAETAR
jgi:hypothetical protein